MMLRFYSLFKQSTDGPCKSRRPAFWDVVGKVKYDAWKRLGDMPRDKAMEAYVNELKQIVETMSYTQNVAEFYNSLNEFDMKVEDIALIAPEVIRSKSQENSPYHTTNGTVTTRSDENIETTNEEIIIPNGHTHGSNSAEDSSDEDEYIDTVDVR
jgi:acyl-CoA-binding protein